MDYTKYTICVDNSKDSYLASPTFEVDSLRTRWHLRLYSDDEGMGKVGVYIFRSEDKYSESISLNFFFKIIKAGNVLATGVALSHEFENHDKNGHGNTGLIELNKMVPEHTESHFYDDGVLIQCEMWIAEKNLKATRSFDDFFPFESIGKNLDLLYDFPSGNFDIMEDIHQIDQRLVDHNNRCSIIDQIKRKFVQTSNQCSIVTMINVQETERDFTLERFSALQKNKKKMAVIKHAFSESFAVLLFYLNNDDVLQVDVLVDKSFVDYESVHCHLSVRDIDNKTERSFRKVCYFEPEVILKISFSDVIKRSDAKEKLLDRDALNVHFVLTFVVGPFSTHTTYSTGSKSKIFQPDAQENRLSRQMEDIFVSRKYCDVTLRAGSQDISCHKAILCHMSPVLDAMFTADMQEKKTGVVHVTDVDPDTLNTLLRYMYSGEMGAMGVLEYMKLYVASDKYQVSSLTRECRKMLELNLSVENVCDICLCADSHSDVTLKKCCMDFISTNISGVLSSIEWRSMVEDDPKLASEVILHVASKLQKR